MLKPRQTKTLPASRRAFRRALVDWFEREARDYPWRRTRDPYAVLISEVMLQQTQIATVLGKGFYTRFLEAFPDVQALAKAKDDELLKAWEGLGYYRRVRMLRDTAQAVVKRHDGQFPEDLNALLDLPGIGRYTAGALRAFAFGGPSVLVDGNVARVIARLMDFGEEVDSTAGLKQIWSWAGELADDENPRSYHSALMELGQRVCRPKSPDCQSCPVAAFCKTREPELLPKKKSRAKVSRIEEHALWCVDGKGRVLMHQESGSRRTGLWKLPLRDKTALCGRTPLVELNYGITRYRVELKVYELADGVPQEGDFWIPMEDLDELAMAAPFRKAVERLLVE